MHQSSLSSSFLAILFLSILLHACTEKPLPKSFSISGELPFKKDGEIVFVKATDLNRKQYDVMDTIQLDEDNRFYVEYVLESHHYGISFYDSIFVLLIAEQGQEINLSFNQDGVDIDGSPQTDDFQAYEEFRNSILRETVYPVRRELGQLRRMNRPEDAETIKELGDKQLQAEQAYRDSLLHYVRSMKPSLALYPTIVRWEGDENVTFYDDLVSEVESEYGNIEAVQRMKEKVVLMKQIAIGGRVADVVAPNADGDTLSLYNSLKDITLIDFWGSWCAPCRTESQLLRELYDRYASQGFEIFGIGMERDRAAWINATTKDERTWPNVSDLNGYRNSTAFEYSITNLPKNFLVDNDGVILARDIHGDQLTDKLSELFPSSE